jgi:hypothetical protein
MSWSSLIVGSNMEPELKKNHFALIAKQFWFWGTMDEKKKKKKKKKNPFN